MSSPWVGLYLKPSPEAEVTEGRDFCNHRRMASENRACQQIDQRWRTAFENSASGIMMADFTGRFFAANSAFLRMLGYTESELCQLTFLDVTHEEDRQTNLELIRELAAGKRRGDSPGRAA